MARRRKDRVPFGMFLPANLDAQLAVQMLSSANGGFASAMRVLSADEVSRANDDKRIGFVPVAEPCAFYAAPRPVATNLPTIGYDAVDYLVCVPFEVFDRIGYGGWVACVDQEAGFVLVYEEGSQIGTTDIVVPLLPSQCRPGRA